MERIPDDPCIRAMERTGYPDWWGCLEPEEDDDVYEIDLC
jgi:hypothetical protein